MPLLNTFPPYCDESGLGYYRRLSSSNSLWKWREVATIANVTKYKSSLFESPDFVASQLELEPAWTRMASKQDAASRALRRMHRQRYDAICPCCLDEKVYLRQNWEHAFVTACPKHGCQLIEKCPACAGWLSTEREHIELCPCSQDLRSATPQPAKPLHRWLSGLLCRQEGAATQPLLTGVEPQALAGLIKLLGQHADPSAPHARKNQSLPSTLEAALEFLSPLETLFSDWPNNFEQHVRARIKAGPTAARTVNSLLGHWLRELRRYAEHPPLKPFLDITLLVCQDEFTGRLGAHDETKAPAGINYKSLAQAASLLGVCRDTLKSALVQGLCSYRSKRYGTHGETYEISQQEITRILNLRSDWVNEVAACTSLGVTPAVLKVMADASVIAVDRQWRADICKGGPIRKTSFDKLYDALRQFSEVRKTDEETMAWSELTSRRIGDKSAIQSVMDAAMKGEIKAVKVGKKVGSFEFLRVDVNRYFGTPLLEAGMSISQLAKATGWKNESISYWISQQLLEAEQIQLRGQPCWVITSEQLLRFRQAFIPLSDLAKSMGTRSSSLIDKLADVDIVGAKKLPNGAQRGALIRIADLGKWAMAGLQLSRGGLFKLDDYT